jgi:hypothetical protein
VSSKPYGTRQVQILEGPKAPETIQTSIGYAMKLTQKEKRMIVNVGGNEFTSEPGDSVWADCLSNGPYGEFVPKTSFGGIISSLSRKGMILSCGSGRNATVQLTKLGLEVYHGIRGNEAK